MEALGLGLRQEAVLDTLTEDVLKSSDIEGERLDAEQVRSSSGVALAWTPAALSMWTVALRDITGLIEYGILVRSPEGGRSTSYDLAEVP